MTKRPGPLHGIRVLDISTVYAAPIAAMLLGDFGADVVKIEHPHGDPARSHGASKDGHGLWWKVISRNKECVTLNLGTSEGQQILRDLVPEVDVIIENFRPGVMEKWGLAPEELQELNPGLIVLRQWFRAEWAVRETPRVRHPRRGDERFCTSDG